MNKNPKLRKCKKKIKQFKKYFDLEIEFFRKALLIRSDVLVFLDS